MIQIYVSCVEKSLSIGGGYQSFWETLLYFYFEVSMCILIIESVYNLFSFTIFYLYKCINNWHLHCHVHNFCSEFIHSYKFQIFLDLIKWTYAISIEGVDGWFVQRQHKSVSHHNPADTQEADAMETSQRVFRGLRSQQLGTIGKQWKRDKNLLPMICNIDIVWCK